MICDIYSHANRVIVWLGPERDASARAFKLFQSISSKIKVDRTTQELMPVSREFKGWANKKVALPYGNTDWLAIFGILRNAWFKRLWIQQGVRVAKNILMICGYSNMIWDSFRAAVYIAFHKALSNTLITLLTSDQLAGNKLRFRDDKNCLLA